MSRNEFLSSVCVLDTETTNLQTDLAEIVEIASAFHDGITWTISSRLLGAENGIPPEASAKNNISQRMIEGLPLFHDVGDDMAKLLKWDESRFFVAHNCAYDQEVLTVAWAKCHDEPRIAQCLDGDRWICTHRLSKQLLEYDFPSMQYNLSYLRYRLDLPVPDSATAHRAGDDTLTCALLFEFLVDLALAKGLVSDSADLGEQMHRLCWKPMIITKWPFGKHRGKSLGEIDTSYFMWAVDNLESLDSTKSGYDADLAASVENELTRRLEQAENTREENW
jgi:DNA polymerase III epsilon subunit-like protein